jgi:hypothetical protein
MYFLGNLVQEISREGLYILANISNRRSGSRFVLFVTSKEHGECLYFLHNLVPNIFSEGSLLVENAPSMPNAIPVHGNHTGAALACTTESCSASDRNSVRLRPDSTRFFLKVRKKGAVSPNSLW